MSQKEKIVVVDDHRINTILLKEVLSDEFEVVTFTDPFKAKDYLSKNETDLVVTDLMMPELDGLELFRVIKPYQPNVPVIILTANDDDRYRKTAVEEGISAFLLKPVNFNILINTIKSLTIPINNHK